MLTGPLSRRRRLPDGCSPSQRLEVLGEVVGSDEGPDMGLETFHIIIVVDLDGGVFDSAVHPLGLAIRPRRARLGQPVLDAVCNTDAVEDMRAEETTAGGGEGCLGGLTSERAISIISSREAVGSSMFQLPPCRSRNPRPSPCEARSCGEVFPTEIG